MQAYEKTFWSDNEGEPLNAENLNHIESGIEAVTNEVIDTDEEITAARGTYANLKDRLDHTGAPTDEQVAEAVEEYFDEHPISGAEKFVEVTDTSDTAVDNCTDPDTVYIVRVVSGVVTTTKMRVICTPNVAGQMAQYAMTKDGYIISRKFTASEWGAWDFIPDSKRVAAMISAAIAGKADSSSIPTKTSQLKNDSGFLTQHQDISGKENTSNKKTEISSTYQSTEDTFYPTVGAVRNFVNLVKDDLEDYVDDETNSKADKSTTLAGYGITNAYTKSEVDSLVDNEAVPAYVTTEVNRLAAVVNARRNANTLTMLFISDMHADPEHKQLTAEQTATLSAALKHAGQAVNALAELVPFDLMAVLGDYVYGSQQTITSGLKCIDEINGYIEKGFSKAQNIRIAGNHDNLRYNHTTDYLSDSQLYSRIGKYSTMPVYGNREKNYGYIDFDSHKVRVIFVNANDGTTNGPENGNVSEEQLQWFADTLGETGQKTGWHILILSHQPIDFRTVSPLGNIVSDYIDGASNTYYNFTNKNSAKLIGNIHGHIHNCLIDNIYKVANGSATATTAHRLAIPNACFYLNGNGNGYNPSLNNGIDYSDNSYATAPYQTKISGGANDTAFTVVTIDLSSKTVYADQYGFGNLKNCNRSFDFSGSTPPTPTVTNYLELSQYPLGTTSGVMDGKRWSGSGLLKDKESETPYSKASGYIPVSTGDIIRMSGVKFGANTVQKNLTCYIHSYGSGLTPENSGTYNSANVIAAYQLSSLPDTLSFASNIQYDTNGNIIQFTVTSGSYITVCSNSTSEDGGIPDNAVLTINEEIN